MNRYKLLPRADADLIEIWHYSAAEWSLAQADRYLKLLKDTIGSAARNPERGRSCAPVAPGYYRVTAGSHFIFYRIEPDGIVVVRVLHQRMDFLRHL